MDELKVALVHYWLVTMRGGEKVLEALSELYPSAPIFTHVVKREVLSDTLRQRDIRTTFISKLPGAERWYRNYLPLMPAALEAVDLSEFDLVISSESGPAKGVIVNPGTIHLCYCHTPMRYLWDCRLDYARMAGPITRAAQTLLGPWLRSWDVQSAARVDAFIANSAFVAARIRRYYGRSAQVIYPPVDVERFDPTRPRGDFYLLLGQLTGYKRPDIAVDAFRGLNAQLVVIGEGEERRRLERNAPPNVKFLGWGSADVVKDHLERCRALIFPGIEDFGMVPVEAMAAGAPVIAYRGGGALETVIDGTNGLLFDQQTPASLSETLRRFESLGAGFDSRSISETAARFSTARFKREIQTFVTSRLSAAREQAPRQ